MAMDMITKRPRTPNDQYTRLTDQQLKNIHTKSSSSPHFFLQKPHRVIPNQRFTMDRYATNTSQYLFRGQPGSNPVCWVGDQYQNGVPEQHNTSRLGASLPWGPEKMGSRTYSHFDGEDVHRYLNIDVYRRHPTNMIGRVLQKHGRPADSYYHQRNPNTTTWFKSSHVLNQTDVLQDIRPKTLAEHELKADCEKLMTQKRTDKWPTYSEYTDCFTLRSKTLPRITTNPVLRRTRNTWLTNGRISKQHYSPEQLQTESNPPRSIFAIPTGCLPSEIFIICSDSVNLQSFN